jgi:uncharacterized protein DUF4232
VSPRRWVLAVLAGTGVVLAACSSSPSTPKQTTTTTTHAASSTSSSTTSTSSAPSSTTSTTAASTGCNHVTAVPGQSQGAAGTITGVITVTNTGATACTADGYPTVALFSGSGAPLTVTMVNGLSVSISAPANAPPGAVALAASGSAQFAYQFSDVPVGSETSCPGSEMARVTMPGAVTPSPTFALAIDPCGNGTIRVSPVYASS